MILSTKRVLLLSCIRATTLLPAAATMTATTCSLPQPPLTCNADPPNQTHTYRLLQKWRQSPDSFLLRFALPPGRKHLGSDPTLPTCIAVHHNGTDEVSGEPKVLKKSYSPVSHPNAVGTFDLLVKGYESRPGGGVGAAICETSTTIGDGGRNTITAKLKAARLVHGSPIIAGRWRHIGLVAGGTGVAPLVQIIRIVLDDPHDVTTVSLLSINRKEEDILMRGELEQLAKEHPTRFRVTYSLTGKDDDGAVGVPAGWTGHIGRGDVDMVREALPPPASAASSSDGDDGGSEKGTMIFVCGTDGFVETWGGPVGRAPPKPNGSKGAKIQGPLLGFLKEAGYDESEVYKY